MCTANVTVEGDLNFERSEKHSVIIRATDKGKLFKVAPFSVTVVDVNDKPRVGNQKSSRNYRHYISTFTFVGHQDFWELDS